jgi:hypothetical protein
MRRIRCSSNKSSVNMLHERTFCNRLLTSGHSFFQCTVSNLWVFTIFWCEYVKCSTIWKGDCECYSWELVLNVRLGVSLHNICNCNGIWEKEGGSCDRRKSRRIRVRTAGLPGRDPNTGPPPNSKQCYQFHCDKDGIRRLARNIATNIPNYTASRPKILQSWYLSEISKLQNIFA